MNIKFTLARLVSCMVGELPMHCISHPFPPSSPENLPPRVEGTSGAEGDAAGGGGVLGDAV